MQPPWQAGRAVARVLLGLFILWQLLFLPAANFLSLFPAPPSAAGTTEGGSVLRATIRRWSDWTGQLEGWALYAPDVPKRAVFIATEFRWDDDSRWPVERPREVVRSEIEPADPMAFYRPFATFRLPCYEANLGLVMWTWDECDFAEHPEEWRTRIAEAVRRSALPAQAYLRWRLQEFRCAHPEHAAPEQVVLLGRIYAIPPPGTRPWAWAGPFEQAVARWRPGVEPPPGYLPVEAFDPVMRCFQPVSRNP